MATFSYEGDSFSFDEVGYAKWAAQGRTDEQKWAVMNFLTGAGGVAIIETIKRRCSAAFQDGQSSMCEKAHIEP